MVQAIHRVTDLMGEISAASHEQSQGVGQVGEAVSQMDQVTQQNASLVEEMAAAAASLEGQAQELVKAVQAFRLEEARALAPQAAREAGLARAASAKPPARQARIERVARPAPRPALAKARPERLAAGPREPEAVAVAQAGDWESF